VKCQPIVSIEKPEKCPACGATDFEQDPDVLDTWFSSWLWPFATMGWPEKTATLKKFYPTTDLVTGPDIIFFWVARMIMAGYEFMGKKPFDNVYYTGIIRDSQGRKMSKSLGNSPNPLDLIAKYGADGLRFGLMLIAPKGQDILFSEDRIEIGRNFMNKLWNASRYVMMNLDSEGELKIDEKSLTQADKWILNRLDHVIELVNSSLDIYQFDTAARALYQFVWGEYCDWYLELSKNQITKSPALKENTQAVLIHVLRDIVKLLHPYAPFITEEIWQKLNEKDDTIMFADFPKPPKKIKFDKEASEMSAVMDAIKALRNIRGEHNIKPSKEISATLITKNKALLKVLEDNRDHFRLAKLSSLAIESTFEASEDGATAIAGEIEVFVPFEGVIDVKEEVDRLAKEITKIESNVARLSGKLSNKKFVSNAPEDIVNKEKTKLAEANAELDKLKMALGKLST